MYHQGHDVTNTEYVEHFKALVGVVETYRGAYGCKPGLVAAEFVAQGMKLQDVETGIAQMSRKPRRYAASATSCACCSAEPTIAGTSNSR